MSEKTDWSPSYTAWKLLETILEGKGLKPTDLGKAHALHLSVMLLALPSQRCHPPKNKSHAFLFQKLTP